MTAGWRKIIPCLGEGAWPSRCLKRDFSAPMTCTREEGIFAGISSGGSMCVALRLAAELENAVIVSIVCDRGDRYLSTGVFPA